MNLYDYHKIENEILNDNTDYWAKLPQQIKDAWLDTVTESFNKTGEFYLSGTIYLAENYLDNQPSLYELLNEMKHLADTMFNNANQLIEKINEND